MAIYINMRGQGWGLNLGPQVQYVAFRNQSNSTIKSITPISETTKSNAFIHDNNNVKFHADPLHPVWLRIILEKVLRGRSET